MADTTTTTILSPSDTLLAMTSDGRYIAYYATSGDQQTLDVLDLTSGQSSAITTYTAETGSFGLEGDVSTSITNATFSADGRYLFYSEGYGEGDLPGMDLDHLFVSDLQSATAPVDVTPPMPTPASQYYPNARTLIALAVSDDGNEIVYGEHYVDYGAGADSNFDGIVVDNLATGTMGGLNADNSSGSLEYSDVVLSGDGRYLTFVFRDDLYIRDLQSNTQQVFTGVGGPGSVSVPGGFDGAAAVSPDGRYIAYEAASGSLSEVFLHDNDAPAYAQDQVISTSADGVVANNNSYQEGFSGNGEYDVFESDATNLYPGVTDGNYHVYIKDVTTGAIRLLDVSGQIFISYDGSEILTQSSAGVVVTKVVPSTVVVNTINGDDYVNATDNPTIRVSGTSDALGEVIHVSLPGSVLPSLAVVQPNGTWSTTISTSWVGEGATDAIVSLTDDFGNTTTVNHQFIIDRTPPTDLAITSVAGDNIINAAELTHATITGTVEVADPTGAGTDAGSLTISIDGGGSKSFVTQPSGSLVDADFSQVLNASGVADGTHTITLTATDPAGNTATVTKTILVDTTPPKIAITSVSGDDVVDKTEAKSNQGVQGTSDAIGSTVDVLVDGVEAGQAVVQADGTWLTTVSFANTITGTHDVTAQVPDEAGNIGRADAAVYVDRGYSVQQLSDGPDGEQGGGSGVMFPSLSADGTKLVFTGVNFDLMAAANGATGMQVYIKNLATGAITLATPNASDTSEFGSISPDGTKIVFVSNSPLDPAGQQQAGVEPGYYTYEENLSDGVPHLRAFDSQTPDELNFQLPAGETAAESVGTFPLAIANNGYDSVVVYTTNGPSSATQIYENIEVDGSVTSGGQATAPYNQLETLTPSPFPSIGTYQAYAPQFSADGSVVAIEVNLHAEQSSTAPLSGNFEIYAGSTASSSFGHIPLASSDSNGKALPFGAVDPALSANGEFVAFWSWDSAGDLEVYRKNLTTGELDLVSTDTTGNAGTNNASGTFTGGFDTIAISADGRYVAFTSDAVLTADDSGTGADLFVKDMQTGTIQRLDLPAGTFANDLSTQLAMRADGQYIAFTTSAGLSPDDANNTTDIYGVSLASFGTQPQISINAVDDTDRINAAELSPQTAVTGTSDAIGQTVTLYIDGGALPGVVVGTDGTWSTSIDTTGLPDGIHQLRASVSGTDGATNTDGDLITIDTVAPTVTLSADNTHLMASETATITASFSEGIGNLTPAFMSATGGTLSDPEFVNDHTYTELFTPISAATGYGVAVTSGSFFDYAGNVGISGATLDLSQPIAAGPVVSGGGQSAIISSGQTTSGAVVESGGTIIVSSGGTSLDTTVSSGGSLIVQPGGFADPTVISGGGTEIISATGTDLGAQVLNGGLQIVHGVGSSVAVASGGEQYVGADGTSLAAQIAGGGAEVVFGTDSGADLSGTTSATATQYDFGIALGGTTLSNGFQEVALAGAVASGMTVEFGGEQYVGAGGTTLSAQVGSGGAEVVFGFDSGAGLSGTQYDFGTASGGTTYANGFQEVAPGATAVGMTVESGGYQYIGSAGMAIATNVASQGAQVVFGSALGALISGTQYDFDYASGGTTYINGFQEVAPAAVAVDMTVASGGLQYIGAGGTALATAIAAQGAELIFGSDSGAPISGTQYVFGIASGGTTFGGGSQEIEPSGTAIGMTVASLGLQNVGGGGTAIGTDIMSQGAEVVHGTDLGAIISGTQYVLGVASDTVVGTGGYQLVSAGGTISAASISGGTIEMMSGASDGTAPITFVGAGELILDASALFSGIVAGFGSASLNDTIDFADIPYVASGSPGATTLTWTQLTSGASASGTLQVSGGGHSADITLLGQYALGNFTPSSDGHGGTIVTDPPVATATDANPFVLTAMRHA